MPFTENTATRSTRGREPNSEGCWLVSERNVRKESIHKGAWGQHPASPAALQELLGPVITTRECEALSDIGTDKFYPEVSHLLSEMVQGSGKR